MHPFPQDKSVLIIDNCAIHKSETLRIVVESTGELHMLLNLPRQSIQGYLLFDRCHASFSPSIFT